MTAATVSAIGSHGPEPANSPRLTRAARQFETVLLNMVFGSLEDSFSRLPGDRPLSGSDHYQALAMQALSASLAQHGGIGIAQLIVRNFAKQQHAKGLPDGPEG